MNNENNENNSGVAGDSSTNEGSYYYVQGKRQPLVKIPNLMALRFGTSKSALSQEAQSLLTQRSEPVAFVAQYGIKVYRSEVSDRAVAVLDREPAVEFATPVFRQTPSSQEAMYITRRFLVQFKPKVTMAQIDELNAGNKVEIVEKLDYAENGYVLLAPEGTGESGTVALANKYYETGLTFFSHPDLIKSRTIKGPPPPAGSATATATATAESDVTPKDTGTTPASGGTSGTYLDRQWHLVTAKVKDAWNTTKGNSSITICILDDGCDTQHPEFNGKISKQFDFARQVADVTPQGADDNHGTACAGVATAKGVKSFGSAPGCKLMVGRTPQYLGVADEAKMFTWAADNGADVISCSWGPADGTGESDPQPDNVRAAIHEVVKSGGRGRGGKGISICWAGGNGDESVSLDGYASNPDVMAIAASTSKETKAWYSDHGPEIWICAPSSGNTTLGEKGIFTVDRHGADGYNKGSEANGDAAGNYTNSFGGTSSATPLVAGIIGLMLSVNANLTAPQVREILKRTADKIGSGYDSNGHSDIFGFGRVNALKATQMAKNPPAVKDTGGNTGGNTGNTGGNDGNGGNTGGNTGGNDGGNGGNTGGDTTKNASIKGPDSVSRTDGAPSFDVTIPQGQFYAVEVAKETSLLSAQQSSEGFFASWENSSFMSDPTYTLDSDAWDRLKSADKLYYRIWTSSNQSQWENQQAYPSNDQVDSAPSMEVTGDSSSNPDNTDNTDNPDNTNPDNTNPDNTDNTGNSDNTDNTDNTDNSGSSDDSGSSDSSNNSDNTDNSGSSDSSDNTDSSGSSDDSGSSDSSGNDSGSSDSTDNSDNSGSSDSSGSSDGSDSTDRSVSGRTAPKNQPGQPPSIEGPDAADPNGQPPTFRVDPGSNAFYAVEFASEAKYLGDAHKEGLTTDHFYALWTHRKLLRANGPTTYTIPIVPWRRLKKAARLYYRVVTSSDATKWVNTQSSLADSQYAKAPFVDLAHPVIVPHSVDSGDFHPNVWERA